MKLPGPEAYQFITTPKSESPCMSKEWESKIIKTSIINTLKMSDTTEIPKHCKDCDNVLFCPDYKHITDKACELYINNKSKNPHYEDGKPGISESDRLIT